MTERQVRLVESSFAQLKTHGLDALTEAFYSRLFEGRPEVRGMFDDDMTAQRKKFAVALTSVVAWVHSPKGFRSYMRDLGRVHREHNVVVAQHDLFREVMVAVNAEATAPGEETLAAWRDAWNAVTEELLRA